MRAAVFLLFLAAAGPVLADGFHSPLLRNTDPKKWAVTERERLGLDRPDTADEGKAGGPVPRGKVKPLVDVLRYLDRKNVLLREFPNFNYDNIPDFKSETEALLIAIGRDAVPLLVDTIIADLKGETGQGDLKRVGDFRERVVRILIAIGEDAVDKVIYTLRAEPDAKIRQVMLRILREIVVDPDFKSDVDAWVRWHRIWKAGITRDAGQVKPLIEALEDPDRRIRLASIRALGEIGSRKAVPGLLHRLEGKNDLVTVEALIRSLVTIGDPVAVPALIQLLESGSSKMREAAATGLRFLTRRTMGFDSKAGPEERAAAVARWREWWLQQPK